MAAVKGVKFVVEIGEKIPDTIKIIENNKLEIVVVDKFLTSQYRIQPLVMALRRIGINIESGINEREINKIARYKGIEHISIRTDLLFVIKNQN